MKTFTLLVGTAMVLAACNNSSTTAEKKETQTETKVAGMSTEENVRLPYPLEHGGNWLPGSKQNLKIALESLKNWENKDFDASTKDFADTVELRYDGFEKRASKAAAKQTFTAQRNAYRDVKIMMEDYETVKSADGKEEWVSVWYKQKFQDMGSRWDSISVMDDIKMVNGRIALIDEKTRHFAKKN